MVQRQRRSWACGVEPSTAVPPLRRLVQHGLGVDHPRLDGSATYGAVKGPGYDSTPGNHDQETQRQATANRDENGALGIFALLHEGCVCVGWWSDRGYGVWLWQFREAPAAAAAASGGGAGRIAVAAGAGARDGDVR